MQKEELETERVDDDRIMRLLKLILKAGGKKGVPQGGVCTLNQGCKRFKGEKK